VRRVGMATIAAGAALRALEAHLAGDRLHERRMRSAAFRAATLAVSRARPG
jgi:hypothetical protein